VAHLLIRYVKKYARFSTGCFVPSQGYDEPVKTAHSDLARLSVIEVEVGTYETINSLQQINALLLFRI